MPSVGVRLYSYVYKHLLKHYIQQIGNGKEANVPGINRVPANPSFVDGVATKDVNLYSPALSLRIFLPEAAVAVDRAVAKLHRHSHDGNGFQDRNVEHERDAQHMNVNSSNSKTKRHTRNSHSWSDVEENWKLLKEDEPNLFQEHHSSYQGYLPHVSSRKFNKKLPIILNFHGGAFILGSKDSAADDSFCRKVAKACKAMVVSVGYRLAPEHKYPAAFDDGMAALVWLAKQANLAGCTKSVTNVPRAYLLDELHWELVDTFGDAMIEPWIAAHGDPSRCVIIGCSSGANIANYVTQMAVQAGRQLDPVKVVAQILLCPFFLGKPPTASELKLSNSYFYDKATCILAWKHFLPDKDFNLDHPAANPLQLKASPLLKSMPPTLTVVAELDWMKDRAIAYSEELRRAKIDAPVFQYRDAVHEFPTLLTNSREAEACIEEITIWVKKFIT